MNLIAINQSGEPEFPIAPLPPMAQEILEQTADLYRSSGYKTPWIGYLAIEAETCIGFCAFKSAPRHGVVEIAYATMPGCEGRGIATWMAQQLIDSARAQTADIIITAQTLMEENASTAILRKHRFKKVGAVDHPDDGRVWEWRLASVS